MALSSTVSETLLQLALFADLPPAKVEAIAHAFGEQAFGEGRRVLRQNLSGSGLFVILEGEAAVRLGGREVARLGRGEFFGEISAPDRGASATPTSSPSRCSAVSSSRSPSSKGSSSSIRPCCCGC